MNSINIKWVENDLFWSVQFDIDRLIVIYKLLPIITYQISPLLILMVFAFDKLFPINYYIILFKAVYFFVTFVVYVAVCVFVCVFVCIVIIIVMIWLLILNDILALHNLVNLMLIILSNNSLFLMILIPNHNHTSRIRLNSLILISLDRANKLLHIIWWIYIHI